MLVRTAQPVQGGGLSKKARPATAELVRAKCQQKHGVKDKKDTTDNENSKHAKLGTEDRDKGAIQRKALMRPQVEQHRHDPETEELLGSLLQRILHARLK